MYVLVQKEKTRNTGEEKFFESLPDGRVIVSINDLKSFGSLIGVDILMSKREVIDLINEQKASGLYPEPSVNDQAVDTPNNGLESIEPAPGDTPTVIPEIQPDSSLQSQNEPTKQEPVVDKVVTNQTATNVEKGAKA